MAQPPILMTTTGTLSPVPLNDLGKIPGYTHPTTNYDLLDEFNIGELAKSGDLQDAVDSGYITLHDQYGLSITEVFAQLVASIEVQDEGVSIADYAAILNFYGAALTTGITGGRIDIVGLQGDQGAQGLVGAIGSQGQFGFQGSQGIVGPTGFNNLDAVDSFNVSAAFNGTLNDSNYLDGVDGVGMEIVAYVAPFDCILTAISAGSDGNPTGDWRFDVLVGTVLQTGATLDFPDTADFAYDFSSYESVAQFDAGDKVQLYVTKISVGGGNNIKKPRMNAIFRRVVS